MARRFTREHEGTGGKLELPTQIRAREEYCRREGYEVLERFKEEAESAKTTDRPELLKPLRTVRGVVSQEGIVPETRSPGPKRECLGSFWRDQLREVKLVTRIFTSWNQLDGWLRQIEALRRAA